MGYYPYILVVLYIHVNSFFVILGCYLDWTGTKRRIKCLAQTHNTVFCLFDLILYVPSTIFQLNWVEPALSYDKCVLLKDKNAVTSVRLKPTASQSRVKYSTTEPLRSLHNRVPMVRLKPLTPQSQVQTLPLSHCAPPPYLGSAGQWLSYKF